MCHIGPSVQIFLILQQLLWLSEPFSFSTGAATPANNNERYQQYRERRRKYASRLSLAKATETDEELLLSTVGDILVKNANLLDRSAILKAIDDEQAKDVEACSSLPAEVDPSVPNSVDHEWIYAGRKDMQRPIAIKTAGSQPLLNASSIQLIRSAAERRWSNPDSGATSRFTYQRKGNYEVHLNDLASADSNVQSIVDELLLSKVYPLIRDAFSSSDGIDDIDSLRFCVYDSLIIRYNATEANEGVPSSLLPTSCGASQPLHRDLGLISVNIMLNSDEGFEGGGTAFENQFLDIDSLEDLYDEGSTASAYRPLKPIGPGHALAHLSSERHAGSSTRRGVRDILVIFSTATRIGSDAGRAPMLERSARLKAAARAACQYHENAADSALCRALHHRLAIESVPHDGEAWHYLGMALGDYYLSGIRENDDAETVHQASLDCMTHATRLTPCDGRLFNNLGLCLGQRFVERRQDLKAADADELYQQVRQSYERAALLHRATELAGCDVGHEHDSSVLNHGLFVSNMDQFEEAAELLSQVTGLQQPQGESGEGDSEGQWIHLQILKDAEGLRRFCKKQAQQMQIQRPTTT